MKNVAKLITVSIMSMASSAALAETGAYVAGDLGQTSYGYGSSNPVMVRASVGYDFLEILDNQLTIGAEAGIASFGSSSTPAVSVKTTGLMAAGVATYKIPKVEGLSAFAKVGAIRTNTNSSVSGGQNSSGIYEGIGVMYDIARNVAVRAEYDDYGNVQTVRPGFNYGLTTVSAGVVFRLR
jgi:opacity protein-like surface antigen